MSVFESVKEKVFGKPKYTAVFRMTDRPYLAGIIVFDDGKVKMNRNLIKPGTKLAIELEGKVANSLQVETCRHIWLAITKAFPFDLAMFGEGVVQNSAYILTGEQ